MQTRLAEPRNPNMLQFHSKLIGTIGRKIELFFESFG